MEKMHYLTPPSEWMEGLPIGNGRLAAMVWGDATDRLTLNHEWLWTGVNRYREVPDAADSLPFLRQLILKEDYFRATAMANALWGGTGGISGLPNRVDPYQPAGELTFTPDHDAFAGRELDIRTGVARVFRASGLTAEFFADCKGSCIAAYWSSRSTEIWGERYSSRGSRQLLRRYRPSIERPAGSVEKRTSEGCEDPRRP